MPLLHEELTYLIRDCVFEVHNSLGTGYDEEAYHLALALCLEGRNVNVRRGERRMLDHRGVPIKTFELDLLVAESVILELKCIHSKFLPIHYAQIITYLKLWQKDLGLLVNFGYERAHLTRVPFTAKKGRVAENYDYIKGLMTEEDRQLLRPLRQGILNVYSVHGLGYMSEVYRPLVEAELGYLGLRFLANKQIRLSYAGTFLKDYPIDCLLVEDRYVMGITAIQERVSPYDIAKTRTYLRDLGLQIGLVANFGKSGLEILGVGHTSPAQSTEPV